MIQAAKIIGTGLATTGLIGPGAGIGVLFGALIIEVTRNPSLRGQLFYFAFLGFALSEATGLFAPMMAFILLFAFLLLCAFLASLRNALQFLSYKSILSSAILLVILLTGNFNLTVNIEAQRPIWFIVSVFVAFFMIYAIIDYTVLVILIVIGLKSVYTIIFLVSFALSISGLNSTLFDILGIGLIPFRSMVFTLAISLCYWYLGTPISFKQSLVKFIVYTIIWLFLCSIITTFFMVGFYYFFLLPDLFISLDDGCVSYLLGPSENTGYDPSFTSESIESVISSQNFLGFFKYVTYFEHLINYGILSGLDVNPLLSNYTFGMLHQVRCQNLAEFRVAALQTFIDLGGSESDFESQKPLTDDLKLGPVLTEMANNGLIPLPRDTRITSIANWSRAYINAG